MAGSIGAAISNVTTYPLALIVTRLQIQQSLQKEALSSRKPGYKSLQNAGTQIYNNEGGFAGFYTGVIPDTAKTIADSFLFFLAYNFIRQSRLQSLGESLKHLPVVDELGVGFCAGAFSKFLTTPVANIVTRQQALPKENSQVNKESSMRAIALRIRSEKGLQGFWSGYSASLVLTLNPSLTFLFFETLKRHLLPRHQRSNPSAQATFLIAAISKALASTITYPFSLAKARAQASSIPVNGKKTEANGMASKVEQETGSKTRKVKAKAPSNVFSTIHQIARTEGLGALYEGLTGEVLKGFFSHGITMIVKEMVHRMVIHLYYAVLKLLKKYPAPSALAEEAREKTEQAFGSTLQSGKPLSSMAENALENSTAAVRKHTHQAFEAGEQTVGEASTVLEEGFKATKNQAAELSNQISKTVAKNTSKSGD